jgi:hypothetical protein
VTDFITAARQMYAEERARFFLLARDLWPKEERHRAQAWSILCAIGEVSAEEGFEALKREMQGAATGDAARTPNEPQECAYGHTSRVVGCVSCVLVFDRAIPGLPLAAAGAETPTPEEQDDPATTALLAALDELYPLPDDAQRVERAGRTAFVLKRWMAYRDEELITMIPRLMARFRPLPPPPEPRRGISR